MNKKQEIPADERQEADDVLDMIEDILAQEKISDSYDDDTDYEENDYWYQENIMQIFDDDDC